MAGTTGRALHARLFLEGMEVPLIGATITNSVNTASIAYIDVVPHESINNIKPRTLVHLFVRDYQDVENGFPYILAFEGEVFGFTFGKTPTSRTMSLSCIDFSSYWDNALVYFFNPLQSLAKGAEQLQPEGLTQLDVEKQKISTITVSHSISSYFLEQITKAGGDLLDGFIEIYKSVNKLNEFYKYAETRLKIIDRIRLKSSNNIKILLSNQQARDWFEGIVGQTNGYQTLRTVIQDMMSIIFHDGVTIPFPAKVNSKITEFIFKPNMYMLPPPSCNIFYPDEYSSFNFTRNFFQEPTRLIYQPQLPLFGSPSGVNLPHTYAPDSFAYYMKSYGNKAMPSDLIGTEATQVDADRFGRIGDVDNSDASVTNNKRKREQQFLTNEELMKGILLTNEMMVPSVTQFRGSLGEQGNKNLSRLIAQYLFFKKRFQGREVQITSHLKPSVVPGFTCMILDDSDANQTLLAYCNSVTHRVYATQGGYTNVNLSYARTVEEQDITSGKSGEPLIPPWFDKAIFGEVTNGQLKPPAALDSFYADLLGSMASKTIIGYAKKTTISEAASFIRSEYIEAKKKGPESVNSLIRKVTHRDYASMRETFSALGATTSAKDDTLPYMEFTGFNNTKMDDLKSSVVRTYRNTLQSSRGFRG